MVDAVPREVPVKIRRRRRGVAAPEHHAHLARGIVLRPKRVRLQGRPRIGRGGRSGIEHEEIVDRVAQMFARTRIADSRGEPTRPLLREVALDVAHRLHGFARGAVHAPVVERHRREHLDELIVDKRVSLQVARERRLVNRIQIRVIIVGIVAWGGREHREIRRHHPRPKWTLRERDLRAPARGIVLAGAVQRIHRERERPETVRGVLRTFHREAARTVIAQRVVGEVEPRAGRVAEHAFVLVNPIAVAARAGGETGERARSRRVSERRERGRDGGIVDAGGGRRGRHIVTRIERHRPERELPEMIRVVVVQTEAHFGARHGLGRLVELEDRRVVDEIVGVLRAVVIVRVRIGGPEEKRLPDLREFERRQRLVNPVHREREGLLHEAAVGMHERRVAERRILPVGIGRRVAERRGIDHLEKALLGGGHVFGVLHSHRRIVARQQRHERKDHRVLLREHRLVARVRARIVLRHRVAVVSLAGRHERAIGFDELARGVARALPVLERRQRDLIAEGHPHVVVVVHARAQRRKIAGAKQQAWMIGHGSRREDGR